MFKLAWGDVKFVRKLDNFNKKKAKWFCGSRAYCFIQLACVCVYFERIPATTTKKEEAYCIILKTCKQTLNPSSVFFLPYLLCCCYLSKLISRLIATNNSTTNSTSSTTRSLALSKSYLSFGLFFHAKSKTRKSLFGISCEKKPHTHAHNKATMHATLKFCYLLNIPLFLLNCC